MFKQDLIEIATAVQAYCPFFATIFPDVKQDETSRLIVAAQQEGSAELQPIFPDDRYGNYCYLRTGRSALLSDDGTVFPPIGNGRSGMLATTIVTLVAIADGVDEKELAAALVSAIGRMSNVRTRPSTLHWDREIIVRNELAGWPKTDVNAVLQRLSQRRIVSLQFDLISALAFPTSAGTATL